MFRGHEMIFLDPMTRTHLENKYKTVPDYDFVGKKIQKMLAEDRKRLDDTASCEHKEGSYEGKKTCCTKCGSFYKEGMGSNWQILTETK